jgi:aspartyl protease family protein
MGVIAALWLAVTAAGAEEAVRAAAVALFKDKAVLVINGKRRTLKSGAVSPEGVRLLEANSEFAVIEIDDKQLTLRLDGRIVGHYARGVASKTLQLYPDASGHYVVDGLINGNRVRFLVDTGATAVIINKNTAKRMGLLYRVDGRASRVETASGIVASYNVEFAEVSVRALTLKRVDGVVIDGEYPRVALLGQSFLNRLNMRRDGRMLELRER